MYTRGLTFLATFEIQLVEGGKCHHFGHGFKQNKH
jgi:hypothetical protein